MARKWQIQEAKNHLSEVVDLALEVGPQTITRHGKEVAVVVSKADFAKRPSARRARGTILPFLRSLKLGGVGLEVARSRDTDRDSGL